MDWFRLFLLHCHGDELLAPLQERRNLVRLLTRNKTSANRLDIIYDAGADLYNMRFYRRTFSKKTFECKEKDIAVHEGIYFDMLEEMFTMVTGLYTRF